MVKNRVKQTDKAQLLGGEPSKAFLCAVLTALLLASTAGFKGGSGTSSDPYRISNCNQLQNMSGDLDAHYELVSDVNCSDTETWNYNSTSDNYKGFKPVGTFTGSLNGQGYVIHELYIDRTSTFTVGLFSTVKGSVKNLGLRKVDITGQRYTGGLAGRVRDTTVSKIFTTGSVTDNEIGAGGIVGRLSGGKVRKSYSHASSDGSDDVGGLAGKEDNAGDIYNSYSTGAVSGSTDVGGLIGKGYYLDVYTSYWDTESSGQSTSAGGTGRISEEMNGSAASTNMSFDYSSVWETVEASDSDATTDGYPILQSIDRKEQLKAQGVYNAPMTVNVTWTDNSENEDGFNIYTNATGNWQQIGTSSANSEKYQHTSTSISSGMYVCYNVTAYNQYGESEPLNGCATIN